jgi:hypothetical protein
MTGTATAKGRVATPRHHRHPKGGSGGGVTAPATPPTSAITVSVDPSSPVETDADIFAVIQVEATSSFAGAQVLIDSSQLESACATVTFESAQVGAGINSILDFLDGDGNGTVVVEGTDCAPGASLIVADLTTAPYLTATTVLSTLAPTTTTPGVTGYPANEVETGNSANSGTSDVYAVFYVETDPVYAEQTVEIESDQLEDRCAKEWRWEPAGGTPVFGVPPANGPVAQATLDDDGNAVFAFFGLSCAPGASSVIADVDAGSHPSYTTTYTFLAPAPTV